MTDNVLSGLITKRAELLRDLTIARNRLAMLEADLTHIEGSIRVFAPDIELRDQGKRIPAVYAAPAGDMARFIFDFLRPADGPVKTRDVTLYVMEKRGLCPEDRRLHQTMLYRTGAALTRLQKAGTERSLDLKRQCIRRSVAKSHHDHLCWKEAVALGAVCYG